MKFELDGTIVKLQISNYRKSTLTRRFEEWCDISLSITSSVITYSETGKFLLCHELEELCGKLEALISGRMKNREHLFFAEPVLEFRLRPAISTEDGDSDIDMFMVVNLPDDDGELTAHNLQLLFGRESMEQLLVYLQSVLNEGSKPRKVNYDFEYYIRYDDGTCSRVRQWREELFEDEARAIEKALGKGLHFAQMDELGELRSRLEDKIKNIEADNLRDAEIWTEEYFNEYGTDDPFKVFELVIDVKDR